MKASSEQSQFESLTKTPLTEYKLFIGGIPTLLTKVELIEILNNVSRIENLTICKNRSTGLSKGYAFFSVKGIERFQCFINNLIPVRGRWLRCQPKESCKDIKTSKPAFHWRLFISRLPIGVTDQELIESFRYLQGFITAYCIRDIHGVSKRFGFVDFIDQESLLIALNQSRGLKIRGSAIRISIFEKRESKTASNDREGHNSSGITPSLLCINPYQIQSSNVASNLPYGVVAKIDSRVHESIAQKIIKKSMESINNRPIKAYRINKHRAFD